jgi:hypothetical protein
MKKSIILATALASIVSSPAFAREKSDVVWLVNGDRITGEIKRLEHGVLRLGTDSLGTVNIEWDDIKTIESDHEFQFERTDGKRVTGGLAAAPEPQQLIVKIEDETVTFAQEDVVRISQIEETFWQRVNGSMTFGYSFTKASDVAQGNLGFRATHRSEIRSFSIDGSTIITSDQDSDKTQRSTLRLNMTRFRANRWFNSYLLGFEQNDELGLSLRTSLGAGIGRYLKQTNKSELAVLGGLIGTSEELKGDDARQENLEGLLGVDYSRYILDSPEMNLSASLFAFPSITESGRTRAQLDINLRWELIEDLFWDLNYYNTYDSDPSSDTETNNDYGIVTSIGYSF